jgi:hypothetical protein
MEEPIMPEMIYQDMLNEIPQLEQERGHNRQNYIIMVSGKQGVGKTLVMTAIGYLAYKSGRTIYSNYQLAYPYQPVSSMKQLYRMRNGVFLADELWRWVMSRQSMKKENISVLSDIVENLRKRNMDMIFSTHHPMHVDAMVRRVTTHYLIPYKVPLKDIDRTEYIEYAMEQGYDKESAEILYEKLLERLQSNPSNWGIECVLYDETDTPMKTYLFEDLGVWGGMYDTRQEIDELKKRGVDSPDKTVEEGKKLEKVALKAVEKIDGVKKVERFPDSGRMMELSADLGLHCVKKTTFAVDVKSSNKTRVSVAQYNGSGSREMPDWSNIINTSLDYNTIPLIMFPRNDVSLTTLYAPEYWYIHKFWHNSYITTLKSDPRYNSLVKHSFPANELRKRLLSD